MISIAGKKEARGGKPERKEGGLACSYSQCRERSDVYKCRYCNEAFCRKHLKAKPSPVIAILHKDLPEGMKKRLQKESQEDGGHSCAPYFDVWMKDRGKRSDEESLEQHPAIRAKKPQRPESVIGKRHHKGFRKYVIITLLGLAVVGFFSYFGDDIYSTINPVCSDNTAYDSCSANRPYYCFSGTLLEKSSMCGCPDGLLHAGESCREPNTCSDKTLPGQCSSSRPFYCSDGNLVARASICGCPEYTSPSWINVSPVWNLSSNFKYSNPKWYTSDLTYTISTSCTVLQRENMIKAMDYIAGNTNASLRFTEVEDGCPQIVVKCLNVTSSISLEQSVAETIVTKRNEGYYSVITNAEITVTLGSQGCLIPVTQIHQVLHALGFDHDADPTGMLYYKFGCLQTLKNSTKNDLAQIYPKI